eukprot:1624723-Prymnesium_polylepis.1
MFGWGRPPPPPNPPAGTPPMTGDIPPSGRGTPGSRTCPSRPRSPPRSTSSPSCAARSFGVAAPSRAAARVSSLRSSPAPVGRLPAESPAQSGSRHPRSPARRPTSARGSTSRDSGPAQSRSDPESWRGGSPPAPSRGQLLMYSLSTPRAISTQLISSGGMIDASTSETNSDGVLSAFDRPEQFDARSCISRCICQSMLA